MGYFSYYVFGCPKLEIFFILKQIDHKYKNCQFWINSLFAKLQGEIKSPETLITAKNVPFIRNPVFYKLRESDFLITFL